MAYVSDKSKVPTSDHYAIITFETIHVPGDERSRTNPGHGYPAHTESVVNYQAFTNRAEWESAVAAKKAPKFGPAQDNFIAVFVKQAKIEIITKVSIEV